MSRLVMRCRNSVVIGCVVLLSLLAAPSAKAQGEAPVGVPQRSQPPRTYTADTDSTDTQAVRQVMGAIGVGKTIDLTVRHSKKIRAKIRTVETDLFTVSRDGRVESVPYGTVVAVKPAGMTVVRKAAIAAAAVGGGLLIAGLATCASGGCD